MYILLSLLSPLLFIVLILAILSAIFAWYGKVFLLQIFSIVSASLWWLLSVEKYISVRDSYQWMPLVIGWGLIPILLILLGRLVTNPRYVRFGTIFQGLGCIGVLLFLFVVSSSPALSMMQDATTGVRFFGSRSLDMMLLLLVVPTLLALAVLVKRRALDLSERVIIGALLILPVVSAFLSPASTFITRDTFYGSEHQILTTAGYGFALLSNLVLLAVVLGVIFIGYRTKREAYVNAGALLTALFIFVKYFDWLYHALSSSIFFIGIGVLLVILGWAMERGRKAVLNSMHQEEHA
jgi:hypothetical protein